MKYTCIAALALAGAALSTAPASAHGSNCTALNGPYCDMAHDIRHHGAQLPIVWAQPYGYGYGTTAGYAYGGGYYQSGWYPPAGYSTGYTTPYVNTGYGGYGYGYGYNTTCAIDSAFACRLYAPSAYSGDDFDLFPF